MFDLDDIMSTHKPTIDQKVYVLLACFQTIGSFRKCCQGSFVTQFFWMRSRIKFKYWKISAKLSNGLLHTKKIWFLISICNGLQWLKLYIFSWPSNVASTKKWNIGLFNLSFVVFIEKDVEAPPTPSNCVCPPPWLGVMFHIHSPNLYQDNDFPDKRKNSCKRGEQKDICFL